MRGKTLFVFLALATVALAGCADLDDEPMQGTDISDYYNAEGLAMSHPSHGFLTNDALLESPDGVTGYELVGNTTVWYKPAHLGLPDALTGMDFLAQAPEVRTGGGIAVFGPLAFIGGRSSGPLYVIDIMDPANPQIASVVADVPVRDAGTILYPDGQLVVITTSGGKNMVATDATDPYNATMIGQFETEGSNHNIAVVPGTPIVYNSGRDIVDFADPQNPIQTGKFGDGGSCHDIEFFINTTQNKTWAICAGYEHSEIWDIVDPYNPVLLVEIDYPSMEKGLPIVGGQFDDNGVPQDVGARDVPCTRVDNPVPAGPSGVSTPCATSAAFPLSFSHLAMLNHDATVLIMGDETGGGGINGCDFYAEGPDGQTMSGPVGNLWFYDITDPKKPDLRGHVSPSATDAEGSCTAHFGKNLEDTGFLVMGFYSAGVVLVDYNNLDNPRIVESYDAAGDIWDVQYYQGYLFTGDMARGMDILSLS